jgi:hypothetical protein
MQIEGRDLMDDIDVQIDTDVDDRVLNVVEVIAASKDTADAIAAVARETAPRDSGAYADSIVVQKISRGTFTTGYRVYAADPKSAHLEFGVPNRNQMAHWTFRRAVESLGLKFRKSKR